MSHELDKTFNAEQNTHFRKVTVATKITRKEEEIHGTQLLTAQRLAAVTKTYIIYLTSYRGKKYFLYIRYLLSERPNKLENRRFTLGLSSFFCTFHIKMLILGKHDHAQHRKLTPTHLHQQSSKRRIPKSMYFSHALRTSLKHI